MDPTPVCIMPLSAHPTSPPGVVRRLEAAAGRAGGALYLDFFLEADLAALAIPPEGPLLRVEGLWRQTCFEAFVQSPGDESYLELNLAPSGAWAAWHFEGYRTGMRPAGLAAPRVVVTREPGSINLQAEFDLGGEPSLANAPVLRMGLAAVIEPLTGGHTFWALAHLPGPPDFHRAAAWTLDLPAVGAGAAP